MAKENNSEKNEEKEENKKDKETPEKFKEKDKETPEKYNKKNKRKFRELFKIYRKGKKPKYEEKKGTIEEPEVKKNQLKNENKILLWFFIVVGLVFLVLFFGFWYADNAGKFEYNGMTFKVDQDAPQGEKEGITWYHSRYTIPYEGKKLFYNLWMRNDPRKLDKIPFEGGVSMRNPIIINNTINSSQEISCRNAETRSLGFLREFTKYHKGFTKSQEEINIGKVEDISEENRKYAKCNSEKGTYILVKEANKTSIEKPGKNCYTFNVKSCEDLQKTVERFVLDTAVRINKNLREDGWE